MILTLGRMTMGRSSPADINRTKYTIWTGKRGNGGSPIVVESNNLPLCTWPITSSYFWPVKGKTNFSIAGEKLDMNTTGALCYLNAPAGQYNYITSIKRNSSTAGDNYTAIIDLLWMNSGIAMTGRGIAQAVNSVQWPERDDSGLATGYGVYLAIMVGATTTNTFPIPTSQVVYTNTNNVSERTGLMPYFPATAVGGTFLPISLAAGDKGVKSVQSFTLGGNLTGGSTTGAIHLVAYRPITAVTNYGYPAKQDFYGMGLTKIFNNSCLVPVLGSSYDTRPSIEIQLVQDY